MELIDIFLSSVSEDLINVDTVEEIFWLVCNLVSSGDIYVMAKIIKSNLFRKLLYYTQSPIKKIHKEAINALVILCTFSNLEIASVLANEGVLEILINIAWINTCPVILLMTLDAMYSMINQGKIFKELGNENYFLRKFDESNGLPTINKLAEHPNNEIRNMVKKIKSEFFVL